jgi:hypothetical protein
MATSSGWTTAGAMLQLLQREEGTKGRHKKGLNLPHLVMTSEGEVEGRE